MRFTVKYLLTIIILSVATPALSENFNLAPPQKSDSKIFRQRVHRLFAEAEQEFEIKQGMEITNGWAYTTSGEHLSTTAYLKIFNHQEKDEILTGISSDMAEDISIQKEVKDGSAIVIKEQGDLAVPAGSMVELSQNTAYLLITGLKEPLLPGHIIPVEMEFKIAGKVATEIEVKSTGVSQ